MEGSGKLSAGALGKAGRLRALVDDLGFGVACLYLLHRFAMRVSGGSARLVVYALYAQPIGTGSVGAMRDDANTQLAIAVASDPICADFPRPPAVVAQRFADGARCYVACVKGSFGGHIWISRGAHEEDEVRCRYVLGSAQDSAWDFDVYVEPRLRFGRTLARLWSYVDRELAAEGVRWSFSRISMFNPGSLAAHRRLGAVRRGTALFLVIGPAQLAVLSSAPYVHASWGKRPGPSIRLVEPQPADSGRMS